MIRVSCDHENLDRPRPKNVTVACVGRTHCAVWENEPGLAVGVQRRDPDRKVSNASVLTLVCASVRLDTLSVLPNEGDGHRVVGGHAGARGCSGDDGAGRGDFRRVQPQLASAMSAASSSTCGPAAISSDAAHHRTRGGSGRVPCDLLLRCRADAPRVLARFAMRRGLIRHAALRVSENAYGRSAETTHRLKRTLAGCGSLSSSSLSGETWTSRGRWRLPRVASKTHKARWVGVPPVIFDAVCELVPREDRTPDRRVFQGFGGDRFRTAVTRACTAAGVPAFRRTISAIAGSPSCTWPASRGPGSASTSANATSPSRRTRKAVCWPMRPSSTTRNCWSAADGLAAQRPRTSARAVSSSRSSLALRRPTESPSRSGLTAVVCSTSTRVGVPSSSMVGRNDLGGAAVDVGETRTVESASSSSA
jgi:hypothetical protein